MTALWALLIASWVAIAVLALALAGFLGQLRDVQAKLRSGDLLGTTSNKSIPGFADHQVLLVDPKCTACAGIVEHALIGEVAVLASGPSDKWPPQVTIDRELFEEIDPPFVPALARTGGDGEILEMLPMGSPDEFAHAVRNYAEKIRETRG